MKLLRVVVFSVLLAAFTATSASAGAPVPSVDLGNAQVVVPQGCIFTDMGPFLVAYNVNVTLGAPGSVYFTSTDPFGFPYADGAHLFRCKSAMNSRLGDQT